MEDHIRVHFQLVQDESGYPPAGVESVWALPSTVAGEYVLDNVPFFSKEATLGDVVLVREQDGQFWFERVVRRSRNSLVRAVFFDPSCMARVNKQLVTFGCSTEYMEVYKLLAISIPDSVNLRDVQGYLQAQAQDGLLDYEEPILRE